MLPVRRPRQALAAVLAGAAALAVASPPAVTPLPTAGTGLTVGLSEGDGSLVALGSGEILAEVERPVLRVIVPWAAVQPSPGPLRLEALAALVTRALAAGFRPLLCLTGGNAAFGPAAGPPGVTDRAYLDAWIGFVRGTAEELRGRADLFQVWDRPLTESGWGAAPDPKGYAYLLKSSAATIRGVIPDAVVATGEADASFLADLFAQGAAPYVDAVAIGGDPAGLDDEALTRLREVIWANDAASPLWFTSVPLPAVETVAGLLRGFASAAGRGAGLTLFVPPAEEAEGDTVRALRLLIDQIPGGATLTPESSGRPGVRFTTQEGGPLAVPYCRFFDDRTSRVVVLYGTAEGEAPGAAVATLDTSDVSTPRLVDPASATEVDPGPFAADPRSDTARIAVPLGPRPRMLTFLRFQSEAPRLPTEALQVADVASLSVEEILAAHQTFEAAQAAALRHYTADAEVSLHFQIETSGSVDVTYREGFFFEAGRGAEWEQRELFINGVRWRGEKIPEIPLLQPDKVVLLPLEIHLDRRYRFRLEGEEEVDGRIAWKIAFEPAGADAKLFRGTAWIDQRTFARLRIAVRQEGLAPPFVANEEVDVYRPIVGPDGGEHWLLARITGTQIYTTTGRSLVVNRTVVFDRFLINGDDFASARETAYTSVHPILRDTDDGFRYLRRTAEGERVVEESISPDQLFWLGGVFYDPSLETPVPYAGVNYFSFDWRGTGTQMNLFFAGALVSFNASRPGLGGTRLEAGVDLFATAFDATDRVFVDGEEVAGVSIDRKTPSVRAFLTAPLGGFWRLRGGYELGWQLFSHDEETAPDVVVPVDTFVHTLTAEISFNRRGWGLGSFGSISRRADWEPWGTPAEVAAFDPENRDFRAWGANVAKEFYLPYFQKLRLQGEWMAGRDLDRFSAFQFNFFGTRLRGFSGSGLRFDRGAIARALYAFDLGGIVRFDLAVDHARVRDPFAGADYQPHTGVGLAGTFPGPWGTLLNLDWGLSLRSDVPALEGEQEIQFFFLKLF